MMDTKAVAAEAKQPVNIIDEEMWHEEAGKAFLHNTQLNEAGMEQEVDAHMRVMRLIAQLRRERGDF